MKENVDAKLNLKLAIPHSTQHGHRFVVREIGKEALEITYETKHRLIPKPFKLPSHMLIDDWTLEVAGLQQGELTKKLRWAKGLKFTNEEPHIINHVLKYYEERFAVSKNEWRGYIDFCGVNGNKEELKKYWHLETGIPSQNLRFYWRKERASENAAKSGSIQICLLNRPFGEFAVNMLFLLGRIAESEIEFAVPYIRGILAADGWPDLCQDGPLHHVNIAYDSINEARHYVSVLQKFGVNSQVQESSRKILISGWGNHFRLLSIDAFKLHPKRKAKFQRGFLTHMMTQLLLRRLQLLEKDGKITAHLSLNMRG
ncbi:MAG: hypothetical protein ACE5OT_01865 [Candidatus Hadarchaeaceae archaeon]